jgi:hypothetical protein
LVYLNDRRREIRTTGFELEIGGSCGLDAKGWRRVPRAVQALGINPIEARERGYPMKEQPAMAEEEASP